MVDQNGDNMISWEEIQEVCEAALTHYRSGPDDPIITELVDYFANSVFSCLGVEKE